MNTMNCAYLLCGVSLAGKDPRAVYCCRRHKESARRLRRLRQHQPFTGHAHWLCDTCGALYLGNPPTCANHTKR